MKVELATKHSPIAEYEIQSGFYSDGTTALQLYGADGLPQLKITVWLEDYDPTDEHHVFIKNWNENEGIMEALIANNVIGMPIRTIPTGYVEAHECKLTDYAIKELSL